MFYSDLNLNAGIRSVSNTDMPLFFVGGAGLCNSIDRSLLALLLLVIEKFHSGQPELFSGLKRLFKNTFKDTCVTHTLIYILNHFFQIWWRGTDEVPFGHDRSQHCWASDEFSSTRFGIFTKLEGSKPPHLTAFTCLTKYKIIPLYLPSGIVPPAFGTPFTPMTSAPMTPMSAGPEVIFSGKHNGICIYFARILG